MRKTLSKKKSLPSNSKWLLTSSIKRRVRRLLPLSLRDNKVSKQIHQLETNKKSSIPSRERSRPSNPEPMRKRSPRTSLLKRSRSSNSRPSKILERLRPRSKRQRKPMMRPSHLAKRPRALERLMLWRLHSSWKLQPRWSRRQLLMTRSLYPRKSLSQPVNLSKRPLIDSMVKSKKLRVKTLKPRPSQTLFTRKLRLPRLKCLLQIPNLLILSNFKLTSLLERRRLMTKRTLLESAMRRRERPSKSKSLSTKLLKNSRRRSPT